MAGVLDILWAYIKGKPDTFPPSAHTHEVAEVNGLSTAIAAKQNTLVSGTNIRTVNGNSLLGSGDLSVGGIGGSLGSVANRVVVSSGTGGSTAAASPVSIDGSGNVSGLNNLTTSGNVTASGQIIGNSGLTGGVEIRGGTNPALRVECNGATLFVLSSGNIVAAINRSGINAFSTTADGGFYWGPNNTAAHSVGAVAGLTQSGGTIIASGGLTASGGITFGPRTKAALLATSATATAGCWRVTDSAPAQRIAYPDGTNWRYLSDDSIVT